MEERVEEQMQSSLTISATATVSLAQAPAGATLPPTLPLKEGHLRFNARNVLRVSPSPLRALVIIWVCEVAAD